MRWQGIEKNDLLNTFISLTSLHMGDESITLIISANEIILVAICNTLIKGGIFTFFIGFKKAWKLLLLCLVIVASAVPALLI